MNAFDRAGVGVHAPWRALGMMVAAWTLAAAVQAQPAAVRGAHLSHAEGTVARAPKGEQEWHDLQPRLPLKRGDRLWTDSGTRAELLLEPHVLRLDSQTHLTLENTGETITQVSLTQGQLAVSVTRLAPGEGFELGTPNLALRARQPGEYRIDVDPALGTTRVSVLSGLAVVYGENGESLEVRHGQRQVFRERGLAKVRQPAFAATDDFDRWAAARRKGEPTVPMPAMAAASAPAPVPPQSGRAPIIIPAPPGTQLAGSTPPSGALRVGLAAAQQAASAQTQAERVQAPQAQDKAEAQAPAAAQAGREQEKRRRGEEERRRGEEHRKLSEEEQERAEEERKSAAQRATARAAPAPQAAAPEPAVARKPDEAEARKAAQARRAEEQRRAKAVAARRADEERKAERAALRAAEERKAERAAKRAEEERRAAALARRVAEDRRVAQARRADEQRRALTARRAEDQRRAAQARRAEEERRVAQARRAAEEKRLAQARRVEAEKIAVARRDQLARLQEQARRDQQQARDDAARREEQSRRQELAMREEKLQREQQARREEDARRAAADQRQRALANQLRRDHEGWLRHQQVIQPAVQPLRPAPVGVPALRRVS